MGDNILAKKVGLVASEIPTQFKTINIILKIVAKCPYLKRKNVILHLPAWPTLIEWALIRLVPFVPKLLSKTSASPSLGQLVLSCLATIFGTFFWSEITFLVLVPLSFFSFYETSLVIFTYMPKKLNFMMIGWLHCIFFACFFLHE